MDYRTDGRDAPADDEAVWVLGDYRPTAVDALRAGDVEFEPGASVQLNEEHEVYGGEDGIVQSAAGGKGFYAGRPVYDVLVDGTEHPERCTSDDVHEADD